MAINYMIVYYLYVYCFRKFCWLAMIKKSLNIILLMSFTFFMYLDLSSTAHAKVEIDKNDIFVRYKKDMPKLPEIADEDFRKATNPVRKKPYDQDVLEFSIRIPEKWKAVEEKSSSNFILSQKLFLDLSKFYGKPTIFGRSRIEIQALNLEKNLTAEQWYLEYLLDSGYTTEGFVVHNANKVESLIIIMEGDIPYYLRTLAVLNGNKVVLLKYFVPANNMQDQASMQAKVIESFSLLNKVERAHEKLEKYIFLDIAELSYPNDWTVYAKPLKNVDRISVVVLSERKFTDVSGNTTAVNTEGKIDVTLVSAAVQSSLVDEIKNYKRKIEKNGILIADKIDIGEKLSYAEDMDFSLTEAYKGIDSTNDNSEYEFWFTVMVGGNYYYFITLLTPSRNQRFGVWAENTQNYRLVVEKFEPMSGAFLERDF